LNAPTNEAANAPTDATRDDPANDAAASGASARRRALALLPTSPKLPDRAARRRMRSLGRAELTLLWRNPIALFSALLMPLLMIGFMASMFDQFGSEDASLGGAALIGTGGVGMVLVVAVYLTLVPAYVSRREERVLKRLRTGEATDAEILSGTALPAVALALTQILLLLGVGSLLPALSLPTRPDLLLAGIALGTVLMVQAAVITAAFTRTAESAQITAMPVFVGGMFTSGMMVPLEIFPDQLATVCQYLPLTPAIDLVRAGWLGETAGGGDAVQALVVGLVWTLLAWHGVRRYFRWDPRA
jgi:ABC-2 type transport system permease protein